jgi:hypothetical protein
MDEKHQEHSSHGDHWHDSACGHESVERAGGHVDYVHDGHQHHEHDGHWDEHATDKADQPSKDMPSPSSAF